MTLVGLLIVVIILCLCFWAVQTLTTAFAVPQQVRAVILVLMVVIVVLWLLSSLGHGGPVLRLY